MPHDPNTTELATAGAGFVIEWLAALFAEPNAEAVKAHLVGEVVRRRGVTAETAWAWVEGRKARNTKQGHEA